MLGFAVALRRVSGSWPQEGACPWKYIAGSCYAPRIKEDIPPELNNVAQSSEIMFITAPRFSRIRPRSSCEVPVIPFYDIANTLAFLQHRCDEEFTVTIRNRTVA